MKNKNKRSEIENAVLAECVLVMMLVNVGNCESFGINILTDPTEDIRIPILPSTSIKSGFQGFPVKNAFLLALTIPRFGAFGGPTWSSSCHPCRA